MNRIEQGLGQPSKKKQKKKRQPVALPMAIRHWVIGGTWALMSGLPVLVHAQAQVQAQQVFDVSGGDLKTALDVYIAQGGVQLLYKVDDVKGMATRGVKGALSPQEALSRILEGTPLLTRRGDDGAIVIYAAAPVAAAARPTTDEPQSLDRSGC